MRRIGVMAMMVTSASAGMVACGDSAPLGHIDFPGDSTVHSVVVAPETATVKLGAQTVLAASVVAGARVGERQVVWSSSNSAIASVSGAGIVTATTTGVATITARSKADTSVKGTSVITVTAPPATGAIVPKAE